MQGQKEAPPDMQCKDKFLLQSVVASPGATTKDITPEMVNIQQTTNFFLYANVSKLMVMVVSLVQTLNLLLKIPSLPP
jgi:hypothetical protein